MASAAALVLCFVALFAAGVGFSLWQERKHPAGSSRQKVALPAALACFVSGAGFLLYLLPGYGALGAVVGSALAQGVFLLCQVAAPVAGVVLCGGYYVKQRFALSYFLLFWLQLVFVALGVGVLRFGVGVGANGG